MFQIAEMKRLARLALFAVIILILAACNAAPAEQVEVTRVVEVQSEPEQVEVTRVVEVEGTPEVVVEIVTATPPPEPTDAPKPEGNIVLWGWTAAIRDTLEAAGIVEDFNAEFPDVSVEITYYAPQDVYTNLPLALTAGEGAPDVALVENSHVAEYVHLGGLLDLTDRVQPYLEQMNEYKWHDCEMDGRYYCMPWDSGPVVMYYRRDVFEAAGLPSDPDSVNDMVASWNGYLETCRTIKEVTGSYCFAHNKANNYGRLYEMALWQQGLGYYDPDTGEVTVDSPENVATLEMLGRFWEEDLVSDNLEWTDPWYAELAALEQPIATLVEASWMEVFLKSWVAPGTAGKWGVAYMPAMAEGQVRAANDGGSVFVIPTQTQNPDAAWAFVEFALGRQESQLKMFAISGFIPSLETTYDDPLFLEGDSFLGGERAREIYKEVVVQIPRAGIYGPNYAMMNSAVSLAIQRYAAGEAPAEQALQEAAAEIQANLE
ncbi:MAG: sugar ABC transporter substrate-binding protein [Chloroflexi bacterium]|nr:sugar ABC transporter substrate-binding protein [Chloroflexota bacterium]MCI0578196.1 sugar ABC transporter substrate-binding protein [Chloroflexota bacterium]MCI0645311.1 sugar ABC transporter substrate-binding protein [Chloroflexota bacterium]MCI0729535.1 sugar ABC transporter substrate-binding protein [Chloroflexota bacterium]